MGINGAGEAIAFLMGRPPNRQCTACRCAGVGFDGETMSIPDNSIYYAQLLGTEEPWAFIQNALQLGKLNVHLSVNVPEPWGEYKIKQRLHKLEQLRGLMPFNGDQFFNQDLLAWDVSAVTNMTWVDNNVRSFNKDLYVYRMLDNATSQQKQEVIEFVKRYNQALNVRRRWQSRQKQARIFPGAERQANETIARLEAARKADEMRREAERSLHDKATAEATCLIKAEVDRLKTIIATVLRAKEEADRRTVSRMESENNEEAQPVCAGEVERGTLTSTGNSKQVDLKVAQGNAEALHKIRVLLDLMEAQHRAVQAARNDNEREASRLAAELAKVHEERKRNQELIRKNKKEVSRLKLEREAHQKASQKPGLESEQRDQKCKALRAESEANGLSMQRLETDRKQLPGSSMLSMELTRLSKAEVTRLEAAREAHQEAARKAHRKRRKRRAAAGIDSEDLPAAPQKKFAAALDIIHDIRRDMGSEVDRSAGEKPCGPRRMTMIVHTAGGKYRSERERVISETRSLPKMHNNRTSV